MSHPPLTPSNHLKYLVYLMYYALLSLKIRFNILVIFIRFILYDIFFSSSFLRNRMIPYSYVRGRHNILDVENNFCTHHKEEKDE